MRITITTGTVSGMGVLGFVLYGSLILLPLFMQELLGFPAQTGGFCRSSIFGCFAIAPSAPVCRRRDDAHPPDGHRLRQSRGSTG